MQWSSKTHLDMVISWRHSAGLEGLQHNWQKGKNYCVSIYICVFVYTLVDTFVNIKHKRYKSWAIVQKDHDLYNERTIPKQLLSLVNIVSRMLPHGSWIRPRISSASHVVPLWALPLWGVSSTHRERHCSRHRPRQKPPCWTAGKIQGTGVHPIWNYKIAQLVLLCQVKSVGSLNSRGELSLVSGWFNFTC